MLIRQFLMFPLSGVSRINNKSSTSCYQTICTNGKPISRKKLNCTLLQCETPRIIDKSFHFFVFFTVLYVILRFIITLVCMPKQNLFKSKTYLGNILYVTCYGLQISLSIIAKSESHTSHNQYIDNFERSIRVA